MAKETETTKKKTSSIIITVGEADKETKAKFVKLADKVGAGISKLALYALKEFMAKTDLQECPSGCEKKAFGAGGGKAAGFWVTPKQGKGGVYTGVEVVEVESRPNGEGKTFLRYKEGDEKARTKALNEAKKEAQFLTEFAGITNKVKVVLLKK